MRRISVALLVLAVIGIAACIIYLRAHGEKYSLSRDVLDAQQHIELVNAAEKRCYHEYGHYLSLEELSRNRCGGLGSTIARVQKDGYFIELFPTASEYWVRIKPSSEARLISLYSDQTGIIRLGTRHRLPTGESPPLRRQQ